MLSMAPMSKFEKIKTVRSFLNEVGRDKFQLELGHSTQVVTRALADNLMPAHWFVEVRDWAAKRGIDAPEYLFRFNRKPLDTTQNVHGASDVQGGAPQ